MTARRALPGWILAGLAAAGLACARPAPPSGGPEDLQAPALAAVTPESLAVNVPTEPVIRVEFTEKVDGKRLDQALWIRPHNVIRGIDTDGATAVVRFRNPFPDSATVGVTVTTVVRDRRGNPLREPYQWIFSTGPDLDPGRVHGKLDQGAAAAGPGRGLALVALVPASGDTVPDPNVVDPVAVTQASSTGAFDLPGLPVDGKVYLLFAMQDRNEDRIIAGPGEFYTAAPESVRLTPEAPVREVGLRLIDPAAPAVVQGKLQRAEGDTVAVLLELLSADDDSLGTVTASAGARADGGFSLPRVPPGVYRLVAVCDLSGDGQRGDDEPELVVRRDIDVPPGQTLDLGDLPGPRCGEAPPGDEP